MVLICEYHDSCTHSSYLYWRVRFLHAGVHTTTMVTGRVVRIHAIASLLERSEHSGQYKLNSLPGQGGYESMARYVRNIDLQGCISVS